MQLGDARFVLIGYAARGALIEPSSRLVGAFRLRKRQCLARRDVRHGDLAVHESGARDRQKQAAAVVLAVLAGWTFRFLRRRIAALEVHLMTNNAITGATYDIDGGQQYVS